MKRNIGWVALPILLLVNGNDANAQRVLDRIIGEIRQQIGNPNPQGQPGQPGQTVNSPQQPALPVQPNSQPMMQASPQEEAGYMGLGVDDAYTAGDGVLIREVINGAPAQQAGVTAGDLITSINGQPVRQMEDVTQLLLGRKAGETVAVGLRRNNESIALAVTLGKKGVNAPVAKGMQAPPSVLVAPGGGGPKLGVKSRPLDAVLRARYNIPADLNGVVILELTSGAPAEKAGLPVGAVITSVNGVSVTTPDELTKQIQSAGAGATIAVQYWQQGTISTQQVTLGGGGGGETKHTLLRPTESPMPMDAQRSDFVAPATDASPLMQQRIEQLESRVKELEERIKKLESPAEPRT